MQDQRNTRARPGTGHLFVKITTAGREDWYGKWYAEGRQVKRKIGPKRKPGGGGMTQRDAEAKLRRIVDKVTPPARERVTVAEAGERLIRHLTGVGRKPSTVEGYESYLRVHLAPFFTGRKLDAITPADVEAFIAAKQADGAATKSILNYLGLLYSIFEFARKKKLATSNPCADVDRPAVESTTAIRFLDQEELEALIAAELDDPLGRVLAVMYLTAAMTGMRQGELIALRWRDVDWVAARVRIRRNYVRGEYGTPKSKRSSRSVPLADRVGGELDRLSRETAWAGDDDLVFAHPLTGGEIDRSKLLKRYKKALRRAKVRPVRFHDLRHTFGTRTAAAGVPMRTLQEWMGHADFTTTLIYADYAPSAHEAAWVEAAFGPATEPTPSREAAAGSVVP